MVENSAVVTDMQERAEDLAASLETNSERVGTKLNNFYERIYQPGEEPIDFAFLLNIGSRLTRFVMARLKQADLNHSREIGEDVGARNARDQAYIEAREGGITLRQSVEATYGEQFLREVGLDHETPDIPRDLVNHLNDAANKVRAKKPWPQPIRAGLPAWKQEDLAAFIDGIASPLDGALADLDREVQESKATMTIKWEAMAAQARTLGSMSQMTRALYRLVGEDELAKRIILTVASIVKEDEEGELTPAEEPAQEPVEEPAAS